MKKNLSIILCLVLLAGLLCGCHTKKETKFLPEEENKEEAKVETKKEKEFDITDAFPLEMSFLSGVGGWGTYMTIRKDGSFEGSFTDSERGSVGEGYDGTMYVCQFDGKFDFTGQIDNYSYSLKLVDLNVKDEIGKEWIEDRIKFIAAEPYGLEKGKDFILYTPQTPVSSLSEEFISWSSYRFAYTDKKPETLSCYGLLNKDMGYGFFSAEDY